jgi:uncharacterized protein (TIGR00369 family)
MNAVIEAVRRDPPHDPVNRNPFLRLVGLRLEEAAGGHSRYTLDLRPELVNIHHAAHGGVIMTVLDAAMASAAVSRHDFTTVVMTIDMSISFMRPGTGRLTIHGSVVGGGATISFCEALITDESGETVAKALGSFKHRKIKREDAAT